MGSRSPLYFIVLRAFSPVQIYHLNAIYSAGVYTTCRLTMGQNRVTRLPQVERGMDPPGANGGRTWD